MNVIRSISLKLLIYLYIGFQGLWSQELEIRKYSTLDGLSDNAIISFYQDRFGYFWIATVRGLDRFDGVNFKNYGIQNGLPSLICNQIMEDHIGRMWVATRNGIAEFRKDSFYVYKNSDHKKINYVFSIYENRKGQIIANTTQGQYIFNGRMWNPFSSIPVHENEIIRLTIVRDEGEYYCTGSEVFFKNNSDQVKSIWRENSDFYFGSMEYKNQFYIKTPAGIYQFDTLKREKIFEKELRNKTVFNYFKDSYDRWWFTTKEDGILILQQKNGNIKQQTLWIPSIDCGYFEDRERQVWIANANGLMKILRPAFSSLTITEVSRGKHIRNLIPYGDNKLIISVSDGQLFIIDYELKESISYTVKAKYKFNESDDFVDHYILGPKGEMWMHTRNRQLYLLQNNILTNKTHLLLTGQAFSTEMAYHPKTGELIVAMDSILTIGNVNKLDTFFDSDHICIKFPRQIRLIKENQLVIRNLNGEIFLYTEDAKHEYHFVNISTPHSHNRIIQTDHQQQLWMYNVGENISYYRTISPAGIQLEDIINETVNNISTQFYNFIVDHEGSLWCVNNKGVQYIYKDSRQQWHSEDFVVFEISQAAFTDWYAIVESGDKIWVTLRNQLIYFDRTSLVSESRSGKVVIEDVQLQNQVTDWKNFSDSLYSYFEIPANLTLKNNQNTLTFFYNRPTTLEEQGITYSYRLLPADTIWSKPSLNKSVSFIDLKPENYVFQVRCRNRGMEWSDATLFSFSIQKPFWDTTWFRSLLILVVAGLVALVFRIRLKQERAKGEIKNQLLELEMRALRAQMNPHFIYNALNSIQSLVATNQTASANKYISKFARLLRQVLDNSRRSEITLSKELESLRLYIDLEKLRIDEEVKFYEIIDESVFQDAILIPPLVLQPFIENALWHGLSSKEGEKRIDLVITTNAEWVHFSITDNGIGRQKAALSKPSNMLHESTALSLTTQRLLDYNGTSTIDPLKIEDLMAPDGTAIGTRIWLHIRKKMARGFTVQ